MLVTECERCGADLGRGIVVAACFESPAGETLCCVDCPDCACSRPDAARDLRAAFAARDDAIDRVDQAADPAWKDAALAAVRRVAARQVELITDDVWAELGDGPAEPRAMGPVMLAARRLGLVEPTDRTRQADRVVNHARPQRIWRSLIA